MQSFDLEVAPPSIDCPNFSGEIFHTKLQVIDTEQTETVVAHGSGDDAPIREDRPSIQGSGSHLQLASASSSGHSGEQRYPAALASHEEVIVDQELFMQTLRSFHASLGMALEIPQIKGKDIDLHTFYREVTIRGGLEQVIRSSKWKEISEILHFIPTIPSALFVLRKHYMTLLFHYEQAYFFRVQGQLKFFPVSLPGPKPVVSMVENGSQYEVPANIMTSFKKRKKQIDPMHVFGVDPAAALGTTVTGMINGKFEAGYLVTIVVGQEKLMGVLYHIDPNSQVQQFAKVPSLLKAINTSDAPPKHECQVAMKPRIFSRRDPNVPRTTKSGYNIFFKEQRALLKHLYPNSKGLGKKVIEMWGQLPEKEKLLYLERGFHEREKFKRECQEQLKLQPQLLNAVESSSANEHACNTNYSHHVTLGIGSGIVPYFTGGQDNVNGMSLLSEGKRLHTLGETHCKAVEDETEDEDQDIAYPQSLPHYIARHNAINDDSFDHVQLQLHMNELEIVRPILAQYPSSSFLQQSPQTYGSSQLSVLEQGVYQHVNGERMDIFQSHLQQGRLEGSHNTCQFHVDTFACTQGRHNEGSETLSLLTSDSQSVYHSEHGEMVQAGEHAYDNMYPPLSAVSHMHSETQMSIMDSPQANPAPLHFSNFQPHQQKFD